MTSYQIVMACVGVGVGVGLGIVSGVSLLGLVTDLARIEGRATGRLIRNSIIKYRR